jgi:hypothetical protein
MQSSCLGPDEIRHLSGTQKVLTTVILGPAELPCMKLDIVFPESKISADMTIDSDLVSTKVSYHVLSQPHEE